MLEKLSQHEIQKLALGTPLRPVGLEPYSPTKTKWACVIRLGGIGDNLMASSILPLLAKEYKIEFIAQRPWCQVLENNPYIDKLTVKDSDDFPKGVGKDWFEWFKLRSKEYDYFINLSQTCETTLSCVIGQASFYWPDSYRRKYCGHNFLEYIHDVAGLPHVFDPRFYPTQEEHDKAVMTKAKIGERVVGWCVSGTRIDKMHPYSPTIIARIIKELGMPVILFGAGDKDTEAAKLVQNEVVRHNSSGDGLHIAIEANYDKSTPEQREYLGLKYGQNNWPMRRGLAQVRLCDLVIGPDTGFMWSVAMEDVPKVVMLSHASPENITKHWRNTTTLHANQSCVPCWPCHKLHDTIETCVPNKENNGAACISDITIEQVLEAAKVSITSS